LFSLNRRKPKTPRNSDGGPCSPQLFLAFFLRFIFS